jgi:nucleoside-diphosphate-sugar epimerase
MRLDLVVNNLTALAYATGEITVRSDGTPWRPLVHIEDVCDAFYSVLMSRVEVVHNQTFNVGVPGSNYQVWEIAKLIQQHVFGSHVAVLNETGSDERTYRVAFGKLARLVPKFEQMFDLETGIVQLLATYERFGLDKGDLESDTFFRLRSVQSMLSSGLLNSELRDVYGS